MAYFSLCNGNKLSCRFFLSSSSSSSNVTTTSGPSPVPQPDRATSDGKRKVRQYSSDYLKFGFIPAPHDKALPMCLICKTTLCNEAMKLGRLKSHMTAKHSELQAKPISFFENLRDKSSQQKTITNLIASRQIQLDRGTMASYQISLFDCQTEQAPHCRRRLDKTGYFNLLENRPPAR